MGSGTETPYLLTVANVITPRPEVSEAIGPKSLTALWNPKPPGPAVSLWLFNGLSPSATSVLSIYLTALLNSGPLLHWPAACHLLNCLYCYSLSPAIALMAQGCLN